jgi:hypothetical protein
VLCVKTQKFQRKIEPIRKHTRYQSNLIDWIVWMDHRCTIVKDRGAGNDCVAVVVDAGSFGLPCLQALSGFLIAMSLHDES